MPLRGRFTQLIEKNEEGGRYAGQAPFVKARQAANDVDENLQNKKARREKQGPRERERCRRKGLCESERESVRRRWRRRRRVISRRTDGSSISPACYSRSDGMFINRLISEIGVRLRTIAGADSSIAIKRKSIISIWPLCVCRTFRHARLYIRPRRAYIPIDRSGIFPLDWNLIKLKICQFRKKHPTAYIDGGHYTPVARQRGRTRWPDNSRR